MKAFAIIRMTDGTPDIGLPYHGHVFCDRVGQWGAYLISGTGAQLQAINGLSHVYGIVDVTEGGNVRWAELDGVCAAAVRNRLNTWLTSRGYPTIPAHWTYRQIVMAIYKRLNAHFDLAQFDVADVD